jgi:hypothetical protein
VIEENVVGKWNYSNGKQFPYGDPTTYGKAMSFLEGCGVVEDWGCGTAYARHFLKTGKYVGIDGSPSIFADKVVDLRKYRSDADGVLIRHILEHNVHWEEILSNAVASFKQKFVLILFTPFSGETKVMVEGRDGIPDISFKREDIMSRLSPHGFREESLRTGSQYRIEHMFYVTHA